MEATLLQRGEVVVIGNGQLAVEFRVDYRFGDLHRRPDVAHGVVAAFLFVVRAKDAIRRTRPKDINPPLLVVTAHALVYERPDETAGSEW